MGPQGTGNKFNNFVDKMMAKGKTNLQARRAASTSNVSYKLKRKKKLKRK
jgi:hypothetical protein